ncbi:CIC11C00000001604 [Sungouiella intermedia]|uniref:CIC11C00000001604 n=1 Tax=Sungouiella intermedia TaxID=45354 RepID=A0A1L0E169_9ASCO|nr:CIC11C00000001604 [[Candida] intermedia]
MPQTREKHRPPRLQSTASYRSLAIARIVSPIAPQMMSEEMRNTFRISQSIRQQQTNLIATTQDKGNSDATGGIDHDTDDRLEDADDASSNGSASRAPDSEPVTADAVSHDGEATSGTGSVGSANSAVSSTSQSTAPSAGSDTAATFNYSPQKGLSPSASTRSTGVPDISILDTESGEFDRITSALSKKKLKRDRAPGPLRIPGHARGITPVINSAPIRTYYSAVSGYNGYAIPSGYPGRTHAGHVGYVAGSTGPVGPNMGPVGAVGTVAYAGTPVSMTTPGHYQPRRMPVRLFLQPVPIPVQVVQTPMRRSIPAAYERKTVKARGKERRKPVQDVFLGDVKREAPMTSQPPSAQQEYFEDHDDDRTDATEEEMREMESKRRANSIVGGSIVFNDESAFNFKIFGERDEDAKTKFMKVCETTWDQYMARQL